MAIDALFIACRGSLEKKYEHHMYMFVTPSPALSALYAMPILFTFSLKMPATSNIGSLRIL